MDPKVSVVMSVYNGQRFLRQSIESVLTQIFEDFEFIIIDDGSTDETSTILKSYSDERIVNVRNTNNIGLARSLNRGLDLAKGHFIARMDADDVSLPNRLELQIRHMDKNPEIGLLATNIRFIDSKGRLINKGAPMYSRPLCSAYLKWALLWMNPFPHATVMIRQQVLTETGLRYDPTCRASQDYDLWTRLAKHTELAVLSDVCLKYRVVPTSITRVRREDQLHTQHKVMTRELSNLLGDVATPEGIETLFALVANQEIEFEDRVAATDILLKVCELFANRTIPRECRSRIKSGTINYLGNLAEQAYSSSQGSVSYPILAKNEMLLGYGRNFLRCIREKPPTSLHFDQNGLSLVCPNDHSYPILNDIPRFVPVNNYAAPFGFQWKRYRLTQLDSNTGVPISRDRLIRLAGGSLEIFRGKNVLEAGCGAGRFTEILLEAGANVFAVDLSLAVEANFMNFHGHDGYFVCQADVLQIPVEAEQFDIVLGVGVVQHTPNPEATINKLCSYVKPGGMLIMDHYTHGYPTTLSRRILRKMLLLTPPWFSLFFCQALAYVLWPIHHISWNYKDWVFLRLPVRWLRSFVLRVSPLVDYQEAYPQLSSRLQREWAILDTHDTLTDVYKHLRSTEEIYSCLEQCGMENIEVAYAGNGVEARARKPLIEESV